VQTTIPACGWQLRGRRRLSRSLCSLVHVLWSRFCGKQVQHEIVNGCGVLQGFVEFLWRRHWFIRTTAGVTKCRDVRRQDRRRFRKLREIAVQLRRLSDQIFDVVGLGKGIVVRLQPSFERLLRCLLAMIDCLSSSGSFPVANVRAACKSWLARVSQSRTSSRAASSIQFATLGEHLVKQRSP
jgi:hypothetical protein